MQHKILIGTALFLCLSLHLTAKPLDLQMGARGFGMGGAFAAVSDDASAAYWNPAGLSQIHSITLSETNWLFQDVKNIDINYLVGAVPIENVGTVAGSWLMQYALLQQGYGDTHQEQDWYEHGFTLAGARELWKRLGIFHHTSVGVGLDRYVLSSGDVNGAGTGFDVGFLTRFPLGFRLGLVGKGLGADMMGEKVEPEYRLGLAYQWSNPKHKILVASDFSRKSDVEYTDLGQGVSVNYKAFGGLEYTFKTDRWSFSIRGGANNNLINSRDGLVYTAGVGGSFSGIAIQYAFQSDTRNDLSLGSTHRFSIDVSLGALTGKGATETAEPPVSGTED